jgi:hypothetical protein
VERKELVKKLSKYSKEALIATICNRMFFRLDEFVRELEWADIQLRFDKLMQESEKIRMEINQLGDIRNSKSFSKYIALNNKDNEVHKKIDAVMKEMDKVNGRG